LSRGERKRECTGVTVPERLSDPGHHLTSRVKRSHVVLSEANNETVAKQRDAHVLSVVDIR
jgi:hypothetical protein